MPVPEFPSPKSHAYDATVPSESADADASKLTTRLFTLEVKDAVGLTFATAVTVLVSEPVAPWLSVTVSTTW